MAIRFNSDLRDALMGFKPTVTSTGIGFTSGTKTIAHTGNGLAIFLPGDMIVVSGTSNNNSTFTVVTVETDGSALTVSETVTTEAAGASVTVACHNSRGFKDCFRYSKLEIRSGSQPDSADDAASGTLLLTITESSGAFVDGVATNGLEFGDPSDGTIAKDGTTWSGAAVATGTAGWWRLYSNVGGFNVDGNCGTSGTNMVMASTSISTGATTTIDTFSLTYPAE